MTWTWDETDLSTTLAQTRAAIGDTDTLRQLLSDEMITWRLGQVNDSPSSAAIRCVRDIIAKLARTHDRSNVGMSVTRSSQIQHYRDLLVELNGEASTLGGMFVGGTSQSELDSLDADSDWRSPDARIGMDDKGTLG